MGYIIAVTGTDGCGKQTQVAKLYKALTNRGVNILTQSFPNYNSISSGPVKMYLGGELCEEANELDAYQSSSLYAVDRLCTYQKFLKAHYENDGVILFDRYVDSNMVHQACKIDNLIERDKFLDWLDNFEFNQLKLPRPNHVIFLDMPPQVSIELAHARADLKVGASKDIHENDNNHLIKAYNAGKYVAQKYNWDIIKCVEGDRLKSIDEIHNEILNLVNTWIK